MKIRIYGASDDLIEIEGDIEEEFNVLSMLNYAEEQETGCIYVAVSTGTLIHVSYDGFWHLIPVVGGTCTYERRAATNLDDDYTDIITIEADDIEWVVAASQGIFATEAK